MRAACVFWAARSVSIEPRCTSRPTALMSNPPRERHSEIVDDVQPDPKVLGGKLISIPARPTHGLYSHALVQALKSLPAQCEPLLIFYLLPGGSK